MTYVRVVLVLLAVLALVDGAVWEAVGLVALVAVLVWAWPGGAGRRPWPFTIWFRRYDD